MPEERLQKVLAAAGVASRRAAEKLITAGRVRVDGRIVTELGTKVDPAKVTITVDGKPIRAPQEHVYIKLYKPRGVISDMGGDAEGRPNVSQFLPPGTPRVFPVGRLDRNSEGLMLLTDDGALAHKLTHPRYEHPKVYYVLVDRMPTMAELERLRTGIELPEEAGKTAPAQVEVVHHPPPELVLAPGPKQGVWLRFVLREGKKRQIRHMLAAVGLQTRRLIRWAIGPLILGSMKPGEAQPLSRKEIAALRFQVGQPRAERKPLPPGTGRKSRPQTRKGRSGGRQKPRRKPGKSGRH